MEQTLTLEGHDTLTSHESARAEVVGRLFDRHQGRLYKLALRMWGDDDVRDLVQDRLPANTSIRCRLISSCSYGSYMNRAMVFFRFRGRFARASFSSKAFSATPTAMASEILRMSWSGG